MAYVRFCGHDKPIVVTIMGEPPVDIVACHECGASGPKQLPDVPAEPAGSEWYAYPPQVHNSAGWF